MAKVLLVEDSAMFANLIKKTIHENLHFDVVHVSTRKEADQLLKEDTDFEVALLDLTLPDSHDGEIVDLVAGIIPSIVFTSNLNDDMRDFIWDKKIADYVIKSNNQSLDYITHLVHRLVKNMTVTALVADDSKFMRKKIRELLEIHRFHVLEATDGLEALNKLETRPDVRLLITDFNMPHMDGIQLTQQARNLYSKEELIIIGLSAEGNNIMSAKFIKNGANDFINKPFIAEEFYCRVNHNVEMLDNLIFRKEAAYLDFLTGVHNRKYLFEEGRKRFAEWEGGRGSLAIGIADIDNFKLVNDTYGHDVGDRVLRTVAAVLRDAFEPADVVVRFGGEEFCMMVADPAPGEVEDQFEKARQALEDTVVFAANEEIRCTASFGVCPTPKASFEAMLKEADDLLYQAKEAGKNRVLCGE